MATILTYDIMQEIKPCSKNNKKILVQFIEEVEFSKIQKLLGTDIYNAILNDCNQTPISDDLQEILDGGLYKCISFYVYARYIQESMLVDTFTGTVVKDRTDAHTAPIGQIKNVVNEYTDMAMMAFNLVKDKIINKYGNPKVKTENNFSEIIGIRRNYNKENKCNTYQITYF